MKTTYSPISLDDHGLEYCAPVDEMVGRDVCVNRALFTPPLSDLVRRVHEGNSEAILKAARNITAMVDQFAECRTQASGPVLMVAVPDMEDTREAA